MFAFRPVQLTTDMLAAVNAAVAGEDRRVHSVAPFGFGPETGCLVGLLLSFGAYSRGVPGQRAHALIVLDPRGKPVSRVEYDHVDAISEFATPITPPRATIEELRSVFLHAHAGEQMPDDAGLWELYDRGELSP